MTDLVLVPVSWSGQVSTTRVDTETAVGRLPGTSDVDPFLRLVAAFLVGYDRHSLRAYRGDLAAWAQWCAAAGVHPFDARRHHVDAWVRAMQNTPLPRTGKPMADTSIARRLSAVSKLYRYAIEAEVLVDSPVDNVRRPKVPRQSITRSLSETEARALLAAARAHSPLYGALVSLLLFNGLRIEEALGADAEDYTWERGHRVLRFVRKGRKRSSQPLAAPVVRALDDYLATRGEVTGKLFVDRTGARQLPYTTAFEQLQRLAGVAGIPDTATITPHSLRHTFATLCLEANVPLQDVQDALGHSDPRTTRLYDKSQLAHDRHPTYRLAAALAD